MALPNKTELQTMDYSYAGLPFVDVPASGSIDTFTMDYSYSGLPFVTNPGVSGPVHLKTFLGVSSGNIKTIDSVPIANIKSETVIN